MIVSDGRLRIAVEHKLDARQGLGQLAKYLGLPSKHVTHLAFVAADQHSIPRSVREHKRYLNPKSGQAHYFWADFWPLMKMAEQRNVLFVPELLELLTTLGLQATHSLIGNLRHPDPDRARFFDGRLSRAWTPLRISLRRRGWRKIEPSFRKQTRTSELYLWDGPSTVLREVWLDPFSSPSALLVRLKSDSIDKRDRMHGRLESRRPKYYLGMALGIQTESRPSGWYPYAVDVRVPWSLLLDRVTRQADVPSRLKKIVLAVIDAAT